MFGAKAFVMPHLGRIFIGDERNPIFIFGEFIDGTNRDNEVHGLLLAMQLKDGLRRGEMTFLATNMMYIRKFQTRWPRCWMILWM